MIEKSVIESALIVGETIDFFELERLCLTTVVEKVENFLSMKSKKRLTFERIW